MPVMLERMERPGTSQQVLVIGAAGLDIIACLAEMPVSGVSNPARVRHSFGGVARNVAENLARLGQPTRLITAVGDDQTGRQLLEYTASTGVDVSACWIVPECPTGAYLGIMDPNGRLVIALDDMRAIAALSAAHLRAHESAFQSAGILFLDANLASPVLRLAFSLARRYRLPVCADPASTRLAARLLPHLAHIYLLTANCAEAALLCRHEVDSHDSASALSAARELVAQGVEIALVTMAEQGVCYATSETSGHIPAIYTRVEDPTGAGNAMTAAVIFALLNDIPLDDAVRLGVSAASLTLRHPGTVWPDLSLQKLYDELVI
jgi:pseudouridine kinase